MQFLSTSVISIKNIIFFLSFLSIFCMSSYSIFNTRHKNFYQFDFKNYSLSVKDTFYINVQVPLEYYDSLEKKYPVIYSLDGNFYFPINSALLHQYERTALLNSSILVSIGYKDLKNMDSLRIRDYLYPKSIISDEMNAEGGGMNFNNYIVEELIPKIDKEYRTQQNNRILFGHSFGGYFVLYALSNQLEKNQFYFKSFIAASPTIWYNDFYLNKLSNQLESVNYKINLFLSVGQKEDSIWSVEPVLQLSNKIEKLKNDNLNLKTRVYNHLEHMDIGILSFSKGLQELELMK